MLGGQSCRMSIDSADDLYGKPYPNRDRFLHLFPRHARVDPRKTQYVNNDPNCAHCANNVNHCLTVFALCVRWKAALTRVDIVSERIRQYREGD